MERTKLPRIGLNQRMIIHAAAEMADQNGLETVSLAKLARRLKVRTPSLYHHINGWPELRTKLSIYGLYRLFEKLTWATAGKSRDDAIRSLSDAYLAFTREHPGLCMATLHTPVWQDVEGRRAAEKIVSLVNQVLQAYSMDQANVMHGIRGLRSLLYGFSSIERIGGFGLPVNIYASQHILIECFLTGLEASHAKT